MTPRSDKFTVPLASLTQTLPYFLKTERNNELHAPPKPWRHHHQSPVLQQSASACITCMARHRSQYRPSIPNARSRPYQRPPHKCSTSLRINDWISGPDKPSPLIRETRIPLTSSSRLQPTTVPTIHLTRSPPLASPRRLAKRSRIRRQGPTYPTSSTAS